MMNEPGAVIIWEFDVSSANTAAFEAAYGESGPWVQLFRQDESYLGTTLLQTENATSSLSNVYVTVDCWRSLEAYKAFRTAHAADYAQIDRTCEQLTLSERCIGTFLTAG